MIVNKEKKDKIMHNRINMLSKIATANMLSKKAAEIVEAEVVDSDPWPTTIAPRADSTNSTKPLRAQGRNTFRRNAKAWALKHPKTVKGIAAAAITLAGGAATWATLSSGEKERMMEQARQMLLQQELAEKKMAYAGIGAGVGGLAGAGLGYALSNENRGRNAMLGGLGGAVVGGLGGYGLANA